MGLLHLEPQTPHHEVICVLGFKNLHTFFPFRNPKHRLGAGSPFFVLLKMPLLLPLLLGFESSPNLNSESCHHIGAENEEITGAYVHEISPLSDLQFERPSALVVLWDAEYRCDCACRDF